ncbi:MAG: glycosyltransferase [Candidatus Bathyarchaeota archaeon]|nr:glycosyltransferase [Candidatus Bathyarchaeota archaeon]
MVIVFCVWNIYSIPALAFGFRNLIRKRESNLNSTKKDSKLPLISIIVPAKNEEKVIGRLLKSLLNIDYPNSKMEILVVDDNSTDNTGEICKKIADKNPSRIRIFRRNKCSTKAGALNFGLKHAKGDLVATFDADSLPESNALLNVVKYFEDSKVAGVQGTIFCSNSDENMLTKFLSLERSIQYEVYQNGKDHLGLFVSLNGTCQFIRTNVLREMGGWTENSLAEDMELSLRLVEQDHKLRYASDVKTWEETPNNLESMFKQRTRWFRGNIENMVKFGRLLRKPANKVRLDAEIQLFGTLIAVMCVLNYVMAAWAFSLPSNQAIVWIMRLTVILTMSTLALTGFSLMLAVKPLKISNVLWLPFIYVYWGLQSFIALYAILLMIFRRPMNWSKTTRSGVVSTLKAKKILINIE